MRINITWNCECIDINFRLVIQELISMKNLIRIKKLFRNHIKYRSKN